MMLFMLLLFFSDADGGRFKTVRFGKSVLQQMYKFYKEEQFCDFQINVEGKVFKVRLQITSYMNVDKTCLWGKAF